VAAISAASPSINLSPHCDAAFTSRFHGVPD